MNRNAFPRLAAALRSSFIIHRSSFGARAGRAWLLLAALTFLGATSLAVAQTYPGKPVRLVVPYSAGGPLDEVARMAGPRLTEI